MTDAAEQHADGTAPVAGSTGHVPPAPAVEAAAPERASHGTAAGLAAALAAAAGDRVTGVLAIGATGEVWLDAGRVYLATGPGSTTPFDLLLGAGVASGTDLDDICAAAEGGGPPVLDELVARAPHAEARLRRLVHEHNLAALFELMVPSDAAIELRPDARHVIGARFAEPADRLAEVAGRRLELWRRIAERIPSTGARFRMARRAPAEERVVTADEWPFLAMLDGRRTVADVITETGESAFRVCSLLYRLLLEQVIEPVAEPS